MNDTLDLSQSDVVSRLRDSRFVMLTSARGDGTLLSHPMTPQQVTDDADVWFFVGLDTEQATALKTSPEVNIAVSEAGSWLSVAGRAEFVQDRAKVDELWDDSVAAYMTGGKDDPNLGLLRVDGRSAEYWGMPGGKVAALAEILKAKVTGQKPQGGAGTTEL